MRLVPSPALVKQALAGHSWLGLFVGAFMYLICISGTIVVFYESVERWEQPAVPEYHTVDPQLAEQAFNEVMTNGTEITEHLYLMLPTTPIPRMVVATENTGWFVQPDGTLGETTRHDWTHLLTNLHLYLHLPITWGMIVVSLFGALLCGLIVSGFIAHPRIFKDAFALRWQGGGRLEQVDIHNRLSVWGAPFHLMIALTGAWFGLVLLVLALIGAVKDQNPEEMIETVFGGEPTLEQDSRHVAIARALEQMPGIAPEASPLYITVHDAGTPGQFMEVQAQHPGRLIYSENYRFDTSGNYLGKVGFSDGEAGKQAVYSVYRLHFGHFGGIAIKLLYAVLGLALTVVSVTGINIWLLRRKRQDWINLAWPGFVWGTPVALAATAITQTLLGLPSTALFWLLLLAAAGYGLRRGDPKATRRDLQALGAATLLLLLAGHVLRFGAAAFGPAALGVNLALLLTAAALALLAWRQRPATQAQPHRFDQATDAA